MDFCSIILLTCLQPSDAGNDLGCSISCDGVSVTESGDHDRTPFLAAQLSGTCYVMNEALLVLSTAPDGGQRGYIMCSCKNRSARASSAPLVDFRVFIQAVNSIRCIPWFTYTYTKYIYNTTIFGVETNRNRKRPRSSADGRSAHSSSGGPTRVYYCSI